MGKKTRGARASEWRRPGRKEAKGTWRCWDVLGLDVIEPA